MPRKRTAAPEKGFYTPAEAASVLGCSKRTVQQLIESEDLAAADISSPSSVRRTLRIPRESVQTLAQRRAAKRLQSVRQRIRNPQPPKEFV